MEAPQWKRQRLMNPMEDSMNHFSANGLDDSWDTIWGSGMGFQSSQGNNWNNFAANNIMTTAAIEQNVLLDDDMDGDIDGIFDDEDDDDKNDDINGSNKGNSFDDIINTVDSFNNSINNGNDDDDDDDFDDPFDDEDDGAQQQQQQFTQIGLFQQQQQQSFALTQQTPQQTQTQVFNLASIENPQFQSANRLFELASMCNTDIEWKNMFLSRLLSHPKELFLNNGMSIMDILFATNTSNSRPPEFVLQKIFEACPRLASDEMKFVKQVNCKAPIWVACMSLLVSQGSQFNFKHIKVILQANPKAAEVCDASAGRTPLYLICQHIAFNMSSMWKTITKEQCDDIVDTLQLLVDSHPKAAVIGDKDNLLPIQILHQDNFWDKLLVRQSEQTQRCCWSIYEVLLKATTRYHRSRYASSLDHLPLQSPQDIESQLLHVALEQETSNELLEFTLRYLPPNTATSRDISTDVFPFAKALTCRHPRTSIDNLRTIVQWHPEAVREPCNVIDLLDKRLPLHWAIANGRPWEELEIIMQAYPKAAQTLDAQTRLYPFMLASVEQTYSTVDVCFRLLRANPMLASGMADRVLLVEQERDNWKRKYEELQSSNNKWEKLGQAINDMNDSERDKLLKQLKKTISNAKSKAVLDVFQEIIKK